MRGARTRRAFPAVAGLLCALSAACTHSIYPSEPSAVAATDDLLALVSRENPDLALGALLVAKLSRPGLEPGPALAAVEELAAVLRRRLQKGAEPRDFAREITSLLLNERCIRCVDSDSLEASDLALVLERRRGNCLGLSVLYLALAQRLGAPFWGVACPEHYFVRFDDGAVRFNIELTMSGRELPDWHYRRWKKTSRDASAKGIYLKNEAAKTTLAVLLASRAGSHLLRGEHEEALDLLKLSLHLRPDWPQAYVNRGLAREMRGEMKEAERDYLDALALDPRSAPAMNNLASLYLRQGRKLARSLALALGAVKLRPRRKEFRRTAADILARLGQQRAAERHLKAAGEPRQ